MTVAEWVRQTATRLSEVGIDSQTLEAEVLLAHALGCPRQSLRVHPEMKIDGSTGADLVERRLSHEPLAYIVGIREFYGRDFSVSPAVLIPRQETETLVEAATDWLRGLGCPATVLDVGTGSGCIAVSLKLENPETEVTAVDISPDALGVATRNATTLDANVEFCQGDLWPDEVRRFDLIVSNPPYVAESATLPPDVANFEPKLALFAAKDGYAVYDRLAEEATARLAPGGRLMLELGDGMAQATSAAFLDRGWRIVEVKKDLGGMERVLIVEPQRGLS